MFLEVLLETQETGIYLWLLHKLLFVLFFLSLSCKTGNHRFKILFRLLKRNSVRSVQDECLLQHELHERAVMLFRSLLQYITDFLVWEESSELTAELQPRYGLSGSTHGSAILKSPRLDFDCVFALCSQKDNAYYCVLYNDEHHSYDHVIYTLQRSVHCNEAEAQTHTALIDKEVVFAESARARFLFLFLPQVYCLL